jgi:hypothetical protein
MTDCLLDIVGVTDSVAIPFYAGLQAQQKTDIALSSSGLFLDTMTGGIDLMGVDDAEYMAAVLDLGLKACKEASKALHDELLLAINNRFHPAKSKYDGFIGRRAVSATSNSTGLLQGQRYRMREAIAGLITINSIGVCVNGAATFNVYIGRCDAKDPAIVETLFTFPVTTIPNVFTNVNMASAGGVVKLDMEIKGVPQEYYIYWNRNEAGGLFAKNNDMKCGSCGGKIQSEVLLGFMNYDGVSFSDPANLHGTVKADKLGHGLSVAVVVGCDHTTVICREFEKKDAVKLMMQKAAQYKAGELWIEYILKSAWVNRDGLQNREYMWGKRNHFRAEFDQRITAIANKMELGETNCYVCKDDKVIKGTIYS